MTYEELKQREMIAAGDKTQKRRHRSFEENMQQDCVTWLDAHFPARKLMMHHSPNGGARSGKEGAKFKRMGTRAGFPDLIWLGGYWLDDRYVPFTGIEFKYDKGRQEPEQMEYEKMFKDLGAEYHIIRTKLKFKQLMVMLIEKCIMSSTLELTKEEERSLNAIHQEIKDDETSERLIAAAKEKEAAAKRSRKTQRVRARKTVPEGQ